MSNIALRAGALRQRCRIRLIISAMMGIIFLSLELHFQVRGWTDFLILKLLKEKKWYCKIDINLEKVMSRRTDYRRNKYRRMEGANLE